MSNRSLANDCAAGELLHPVDAAFAEIVASATPIADTEAVSVVAAKGRVIARDITTSMPLPPFDHSAVDGYGVSEADLERPPRLRLLIKAEIAAGENPGPVLGIGEAVRLFTGAPIPPGVAAVVLEERCKLAGRTVTITIPVPKGANIRRAGEDVATGFTIVEAGSLLDARHIAILVAAGVSQVEVRRPVRVALFSNGNELREAGMPLGPGQIHDANRPMLLAMLNQPWIEVVNLGCHRDEVSDLTGVFVEAAKNCDVIISSGGVAGSDADHIAKAVAAAGGAVTRFRLAIKPGKPILVGRIASAAVIGLPGNPVAAMVNFLLFGRGLLKATAGNVATRPAGQSATTAALFGHAFGRTEFVPAKIVGHDDAGRLSIEKLGRGGSARLRPLVLADGFAEVPADVGELPAGAPIAFHSFQAAFAP